VKTLCAFLLTAGIAIGGTIDPRTPDSKHIEYGKHFDCVAKIGCVEKETGIDAWASCVIISEHWIVTAAHVVADAEAWTVYVAGEKYPLDKVIVHEDFASGGVSDIAIGHSERKFDMPFFPGLYGHEDEAGRVVSICGYGISGTFDTGHVVSDGKRRAGSNVIDHADSRGLLVCSIGGVRRTELEFLIAPGDSGGGLFIGSELAGINSVVMAVGRSPTSRWGEESGHTRISAYKEWIRERTK